MTRVLSVKSAMRKALVLSFAVHAAIFGVARPLALRAAAAASVPAAVPPEDHWTGTTADLPFAGQPGAVYEVAVDQAPPPAPAAPAPALPPDPPPAVAKPPVLAAAAAPSPAPADHPRVAAPVAPAAVEGAASPAPPRPARRPRSQGAPGGGGGVAGPWGPEGPGSLRDFGHAFTRAIAPASDSDPVWGGVPAGDAGKLEVAVHLDGSGHLTGSEPRGTAPPRALVSLVRRTMVLIQASTFAARDTTVILELRAVVREAAADGTDDQDAVDTVSGIASFTQGGQAGRDGEPRGGSPNPSGGGRHVKVTVRVVRSQPDR